MVTRTRTQKSRISWQTALVNNTVAPNAVLQLISVDPSYISLNSNEVQSLPDGWFALS